MRTAYVKMSTNNDKSSVASGLRRAAEDQIKAKTAEVDLPRPDEDMLQLVHELQVHHIELEMQNEEMRRSEEELMASRDKFSLLYDFAPMGYFTLDRKGTIRTVNLTGATLLGIERSSIINRRFVHFVADKDRHPFTAFLGRIFELQARDNCEVMLSKGGAPPLVVRIEAAAVESGQECLVAVIDITAHTKTENELQKSNSLLQERTFKLEQTVAALSKEIAEREKLEQQLLQAQKMESIGLLAGGVAHEFNNQLTAISGYGQLLKDRIPDDDELMQESIEQVLKGAARATELTRSLLTFSRKQENNPKPVTVNSIIDNVSTLIRRVVGEDVEFSIVFACQELLVMADSGQIQQVLLNLATNARDAMSSGGRLRIRTKPVTVKNGSEMLYELALPGNYAQISVSDTGTGIDEKLFDKLFEPFYTTKEVGKGTGLGLSIAYGIIKQHGGSILVSSESGKWTTFNIYLPLMRGEAVEPETGIMSAVTGGTETLLIAEDEEIVRFFMKRTLEKAGYRVITAGDGEEAVARFRENDAIDLVLSDVVMPKKNGKEILDEIRKLRPDIKVIFSSGYTADILHAKGIREEGLEFMAKPFTTNDLLQKIREMLDRDR
jgi:PAS domain S-box-containing protein